MAALLALASSVLWGGADFGGGWLSRRAAPLLVVAGSQAAALVLLVVGAVLSRPGFPGWATAGWAAAAGLVGSGALVAFYAALARGTMGVVAPIAATGVVVPVLIGLLGGDRPGALSVAGMALAGVGVVLASGPEVRDLETGRARLDVLGLALTAALGFGLVLWLLARAADGGVLVALLGMRSAGCVALVLAVLLLRPSGGLPRSTWPAVVAVGAADLAANACFAAASSRGLLSVVAVLGSLYPVVTVLAARLLLGERLAGVQRIGVVLALVGVVAIAGGGAT